MFLWRMAWEGEACCVGRDVSRVRGIPKSLIVCCFICLFLVSIVDYCTFDWLTSDNLHWLEVIGSNTTGMAWHGVSRYSVIGLFCFVLFRVSVDIEDGLVDLYY